jgi:hypothetical protein
MLAHLKPNDGQRDSKIAFDVGPSQPHHAASVRSVGITGQMTGGRASDIIADDTEVVKNSATEDLREKLISLVGEFESLLMPKGTITFLGTPQTEHSIYKKLRDKGHHCQIWPARYPSLDKLDKYGGALAPSIKAALEANPKLVGQPTDTRFTDEDLLERQASMGNSQFTLQFMLDTTLSDAERYPLKLADLIVTGLNAEKAAILFQYGSGPAQMLREIPNIGLDGDRFYSPLYSDDKWAAYEGSVMAIDPAGRGADETGYAVVNYLHGNLFLLAAGGLRGGYNEGNLTRLAEIAKECRVKKIICEANFGDGMFTQLLIPVLNRVYPQCGAEEVKHSKQKELRIIDTLEPVMNRHRLIVDADLIKRDIEEALKDEQARDYSLFHQLAHITRDRGSLRHDDRLDALAIAVTEWIDVLARDEKKAAAQHNEKLLNDELKKFMRNAIHSPGRQTGQQRKSGWLSGFRQL